MWAATYHPSVKDRLILARELRQAARRETRHAAVDTFWRAYERTALKPADIVLRLMVRVGLIKRTV